MRSKESPVKRLDLPTCLYLEVTNRCNLKCRSCIRYRGGWEPEADMSLPSLLQIADQTPTLERAVLHGVGEPLLNRELPAMIRQLKKRDVYVEFSSNGLLLDERWQRELTEAGLDELRVSLDGASAGSYAAMRGSSRFDFLIRNLSSFSAYLKRKNLTKPKLSLWFLGSRENIFELPDFIGLAHRLGIGEVHLQRLVYFLDGERFGLAKPEQSLQDPDLPVASAIIESRELARRLGITLSASGLTEPEASLRSVPAAQAPWRECNRPFSLMYVTANGNVLPCCFAPFATVDYGSQILGNVFERPLAEVWYGHAYELFRRRLQTINPSSCCRGCGVAWSL